METVDNFLVSGAEKQFLDLWITLWITAKNLWITMWITQKIFKEKEKVAKRKRKVTWYSRSLRGVYKGGDNRKHTKQKNKR